MSFRSQHLECKFPHGAEHNQTEWTVGRLRKATWKELLAENLHACGWTRFDPDVPVMAFLKCNLNALAASKEVGYKGINSGRSLLHRIRKRDITDILTLLIMLMRAGKMPKTCTDLLKPWHKRQSSGKRKWLSSSPSIVAIEIAQEIINRSIKKYGGKKRSCAKLGITLKTMNYWLKWEIVKQV